MKLGSVYRFFLAGAVILSAFALVLYPNEAAETVRDSLSVCTKTLIPTLFPLMCVSVLMVETGVAERAGRLFSFVMRPLFKLPGEAAPAFVLGLVGGYPVGARTAISLYEKGALNRNETEKLLSFCNNSGPAFILGTVGAGVFNDPKIGFMLYFSHMLASVVVGIIFRGYGSRRKPAAKKTPSAAAKTSAPTPRLSSAVSRSITAAGGSMINICAFIIFFSVATRMLYLAGILPALASFIAHPFPMMTAAEAEGLLSGLIEVASGVLSLKTAAVGMPAALAMAAFMLGWAGVSVHFQVVSFIGEKSLSLFPYLVGKLLHGLLSAVNIFLLTLIFPFERHVAFYLAESVSGATAAGLMQTLFSSLLFSAVVLLSGILLSLLSRKT